jgi:hypothetical protein
LIARERIGIVAPMLRRFVPFSLAVFFSIAGCDCGGGEQPVPGMCVTRADCAADEACVDGRCGPRPDGGRDGGAAEGGVSCDDGRDACGSALVCCGATEACVAGTCRPDCGGAPLCGGACCGATEECLTDRCVPLCADEAQRCGAADELCCASGEACLGDACVALGPACTVTEECALDALCDPVLGRCVPRSAVEVCEYRPPVGEFRPAVACRWQPVAGDRASSDDVVMAPVVGNLTDDNGDGETDTRDVPDIAFVSFDRPVDGCCTARGTLRIVDGRCADDGSMRTIATIAAPFFDNSTGLALGNLHPDTMPAERAPELVGTLQNGGTIALRRVAPDGSAWETLWQNTAHPAMSRYNGSGAAPAIADLDGDGRPEVIVGNVVLDGLDGTVRWDGRVTVGPSAGVGNNAFLGPTSTIADLDLDGRPEVIAGNTVYDGVTGAERWTYTYVGDASACGGTVPCDGYNGIGNLDTDPQGEVVIVRRGEVFVLEHDGALKARVTIPRVACANNEGGPPTVADFDGDGRAEIGVASADYYVVFDLDCTGSPLPAGCASTNVRWQVRNTDCSSRSTGSSVFDFDGDGRAEVVYADERNFRIFDGTNGTILFDDPLHRSNTRLEMPIVVDVDNDGQSEVLVAEAPGDDSPDGLVVWTDAGNNWVRTRRIWNQHTYHVTNVSEDGQIPRVEMPNWSSPRLNNFRQNVQPGGLFDAPDLFVASIELALCDAAEGRLDLVVTVGNRGALAVAAGVPVVVRATPAGGTAQVVGVVRTATFLLPGRTERLPISWTPAGGFTFPNFTVDATVDDDGMGGAAYNECDETNNAATSATLMTCTFG